MKSVSVIPITLGAVLLALPAVAEGQYLDPPAAIARILDEPQTPAVSLSPDRQWMLIMERPELPGIEEVAAPDLRLAGTRLDPQTNGPTRRASYTGLLLRQVNGPAERRVQLPARARVGDVDWAPGGGRVSFTVTGEAGIALWVVEVATGESRALTGPVLNAVTGQPCEWLVSSEQLVCRVIPSGRGAAPARPVVPKGPIIQESAGRRAPTRTYQDLLGSPADEALFDHYFTSQVVL
ncbi:MAG TPA: hypothetical protein VLL51_02945, partial [Gemmatimonadales bacterium]|nr:hypothetical protein [Gemmatimonadales bacterium]